MSFELSFVERLAFEAVTVSPAAVTSPSIVTRIDEALVAEAGEIATVSSGLV